MPTLTEQTTETATFYENLYKNVRMGSESILGLLPKVDTEEVHFRSDLTLQLNGYEGFARQLRAHLAEEGEAPKEENLLTRMGAKLGMTFSTLTDTSVSHLADLVTQGSNMGINDTSKLLHQYENADVEEEARKIARAIITFEEENIKRMRAYL